MVKLQRDVAERLLMLALFTQERGDYSPYGIFEETISRRGYAFPIDRILRTAYNEGVGIWKNTKWKDISDPLIQQLGKDGANDGAHHPALIDTILEIITGPYARNSLSGKGLKQLQKAILLPEDMTRLGETSRKELSCANCGHAFARREMAISDEDENGKTVFYCTRCTTPAFAACQHPATGDPCDNSVTLSEQGVNKLVHKLDCGAHTADKPVDKKAKAVDAHADMFARIQTAARPGGATRTMQAAAPNWAPPVAMQQGTPTVTLTQRNPWIDMPDLAPLHGDDDDTR